MSEQALGQWSNAPLAMVLAQIRFDPEVATESLELSKRFKEAMGDKFQVMKSVKQIAFAIGGAGEGSMQPPEGRVIGYDLRSDDDRRSLRLEEGVVTYATSHYADSSNFLAEWRSIMNILCHEGSVKVFRIGLRYVDFIIPTGGKQPEEYFSDGFGRSPPILGDQAQAAFMSYDYQKVEGGQMRVQYGRGFGQPGLPPDLAGSVQVPQRLMNQYEAGESAVLDIDNWRQMSERHTIDEIAAGFQSLRDDISLAFQRVISDAARYEWSQTNQIRRNEDAPG